MFLNQPKSPKNSFSKKVRQLLPSIHKKEKVIFNNNRINITLISNHNNILTKYPIECTTGNNLLDSINEAGISDISVFGVCNKQLACHSCAVQILSKYNTLEKPSTEESDVHCELGDIFKKNKTRMSCQITIKEEMNGMEIEIPRSAFFLTQENNNK
jgi:2Fe-2S ferredoxin